MAAVRQAHDLDAFGRSFAALVAMTSAESMTAVPIMVIIRRGIHECVLVRRLRIACSAGSRRGLLAVPMSRVSVITASPHSVNERKQ